MQANERLHRLEGDAYRFGMLRQLLVEHGCPWPEECHIPTNVGQWLKSLGCEWQDPREPVPDKATPIDAVGNDDGTDDDTDDEPEYIELTELSILPIQPGDRIVVTYQDALSVGQKAYLASRWEERFPGHGVIVLDAGTTLGVIREATNQDGVAKP